VTSDTDARLIPIPGNPPSLLNPPTGCPFHPRCTYKDKVPGDLCTTTLPPLAPAEVGNDHLRRCHLPDAGAIYATEILPEIAPDLIDPETGQPIAALQAVIEEVSAPSATATIADESAGNEELIEKTREDGAR
jgi:oligopeptide/dipeptide ABC transporter ATP-binding protein